MKIKCIAIDDEPLALELIARNIRAINSLELVGVFLNSAEALSFIGNNKVDLLFLDIQMPKINGMELSRKIDPEIAVIFTTAFDHYAVESYDVRAVDYLLKPIDTERFVKACDKAIVHINNRKLLNQDQKIVVSSEHEKRILETGNILYIEGLKDYIKIFLIDTPKPVLTRMNLKTFETTHGSGKFIRIHKSYLVNKSKIQSIKSRSLFLINGVELPVGETYKLFLGHQFGN